jgi:hypothetical protein
MRMVAMLVFDITVRVILKAINFVLASMCDFVRWNVTRGNKLPTRFSRHRDGSFLYFDQESW